MNNSSSSITRDNIVKDAATGFFFFIFLNI